MNEVEYQAMPPVAVAEADQQWHRLDPRMLAVHPAQELTRLLPLLVLWAVIGRGDIQHMGWAALAAIVFVIIGLLRWATTTFRIGDTQVELHTGLFSKKRRAVPMDRIRSVDLTATALHRVFGLSVVRIGTGQDKEGDLDLNAIPTAHAEKLRVLLLSRAKGVAVPAGDEPVAEDAPVASLQLSWLRYAPLTLSGLAAIGAAVGVGFRVLREFNVREDEFPGLHQVLTLLDHGPVVTVVLLGLVLLIVLSTVLSLAIYVIGYYGYRLTMPEDTVHITRGLFTKRAVSLEERRLRGVKISQALLLRWARGAKLTAITSGLSEKHRAESSLLMPPAPLSEAHRITAAVLRTEGVTEVPLRKHPVVALRRAVIRRIMFPLVLLVAATWLAQEDLLWSWVPWVTGVLVLLGAVTGVAYYRSLGHAINGDYLIIRSGALDRHTVALRRDGIIGWRLSQSLFQRRSGVCTLSAVTAAGDHHYDIHDCAYAEAGPFAEQTTPGLVSPFLTRA
ncbi:hypothetical protein D5S17_31630 [Pseudonocardiaceae bacterium YIM PH 21723]|nr:hypothetical protein D5S17_31630 [Pseudonocardiaceae bacterium YIM PH 21723]